MNAIREILKLEIPALEAVYKRWAQLQLTRLMLKYGPTLKGASSSWDDGKFFADFRSLLKRTPGNMVGYDPDATYLLNMEALDKEASKWAADTAMQWAQKLETKIGKDAVGIEYKRVTDSDFTFHAERQGRKITVVQQRIYKVSSRGTPFYQFPARIYVDGKPTTEATMRTLFE